MKSGSRLALALRMLAGALALALTLAVVGPHAVLERLAQLDVRFLGVGVALGVPQLLLCAARWRYTARKLGLSLGYRQALREYGLATFMNVTLPLGVLGDAARVVRHAHDHSAQPAGLGPALRAVVIERASGQLVVVLGALAVLPAWFSRLGIRPTTESPRSVLLPLSIVALASAFAVSKRAPGPVRAALQIAWADARRALFSAAALPIQLALSSAVLATLCAQLLCALSALGATLSFSHAAEILPFMLLSMALPLSIAGFGAREAAAATLFQLSGLHAADGTAFAVSYGLLSWAASAPGLGMFLLGSRAEAPPR